MAAWLLAHRADLGPAYDRLAGRVTAALARGRRTVTSGIRAAGLGDEFRPCYPTISAAGRRADSIAARLAYEVVKPLAAGSAGVPEGVTFATKIVLAKRMIERAVAAGLSAKWVTADAVSGSDYQFRIALEHQGLGYVLGVRTDFAVTVGFRQPRAKALLAEVPADAWQWLSCGAGSKGPRRYDWARTRINCPDPRRYQRWLLIRRSVSDPADVSYFVCGGRPATTLPDLVAVAGKRWVVEECFELAKGDCGLDGYEVRGWTGWHRHVTLSLFALAVVAAIRSRLPSPAKREKGASG